MWLPLPRTVTVEQRLYGLRSPAAELTAPFVENQLSKFGLRPDSMVFWSGHWDDASAEWCDLSAAAHIHSAAVWEALLTCLRHMSSNGKTTIRMMAFGMGFADAVRNFARQQVLSKPSDESDSPANVSLACMRAVSAMPLAVLRHMHRVLLHSTAWYIKGDSSDYGLIELLVPRDLSIADLRRLLRLPADSADRSCYFHQLMADARRPAWLEWRWPILNMWSLPAQLPKLLPPYSVPAPQVDTVRFNSTSRYQPTVSPIRPQQPTPQSSVSANSFTVSISSDNDNDEDSSTTCSASTSSSSPRLGALSPCTDGVSSCTSSLLSAKSVKPVHPEIFRHAATVSVSLQQWSKLPTNLIWNIVGTLASADVIRSTCPSKQLSRMQRPCSPEQLVAAVGADPGARDAVLQLPQLHLLRTVFTDAPSHHGLALQTGWLTRLVQWANAVTAHQQGRMTGDAVRRRTCAVDCALGALFGHSVHYKPRSGRSKSPEADGRLPVVPSTVETEATLLMKITALLVFQGRTSLRDLLQQLEHQSEIEELAAALTSSPAIVPSTPSSRLTTSGGVSHLVLAILRRYPHRFQTAVYCHGVGDAKVRQDQGRMRVAATPPYRPEDVTISLGPCQAVTDVFLACVAGATAGDQQRCRTESDGSVVGRAVGSANSSTLPEKAIGAAFAKTAQLSAMTDLPVRMRGLRTVSVDGHTAMTPMEQLSVTTLVDPLGKAMAASTMRRLKSLLEGGKSADYFIISCGREFRDVGACIALRDAWSKPKLLKACEAIGLIQQVESGWEVDNDGTMKPAVNLQRDGQLGGRHFARLHPGIVAGVIGLVRPTPKAAV